MKRDRKTFVVRLTRLIFCIIVTLLFFRGIAFCSDGDEFESLSGQNEQDLAIAGIEGDLTLEVVDRHTLKSTTPLAQVDPESIRLVPVPTFGVTAVVFVAVMLVGWLRRRTPPDLNK